MEQKLFKTITALSLAVVLVSCSTTDDKTISAPTSAKMEPVEDSYDRSELSGPISGQFQNEPHVIEQPAKDIHAGTGNFIGNASGQQPTTPSSGTGDITLNFQNSPLAEVVKTILGDILNVNYVVNEAVGGSVTMRTASPISKGDLIPVLDNLLRMNGAAVIESQGFYEIVPIDEGAISGLTPTTRLSADKGYQILIVPLHYIGAKEMVKILEPVKSGRAVVKADEYRNLLTIAGTHSDLFNLRETISIFDVDQLKGMSVGVFRIQNADAKSLLEELKQIFGDSAEGPLAGMVRFTVLERINGLMVITPQPKYLDDVETWITRLDQAQNPGGMNMYVYYVQNGKAENLAEILNQLFYGRKKGAGPSYRREFEARGTPAGEEAAEGDIEGSREEGRVSSIETGEITIIPDKETNSLLVLATPPDYEEVLKAMEKLDVLPMQVLVEASIIEVTLGDQLEYGLQWFFKSNLGGKYKQLGGLNIPVDGGGPPGGLPNLTGALTDPANFTYAVFDGNGTRFLLNAIADDSRLNVLSSPTLMVLDNQKAIIKVGDQVPIRTSETTNLSGTINIDENFSSNVTSQIQYRDTGVTLEVTPRVNAGGMVMLELTQRVDDVDQTTSSDIDSPTILQREITTSVAVQSGETIVLGGLIREDEEISSSGIPFLKDIPVMGALFSSKRTANKKTELVVMITPSAVGTPLEARQVTEEYKAKIKGVDLSKFK